METSTKQVDSCIKMFALLKLLLEDNANFSQVIKVISDEESSISPANSIHSVTLNKYLNTLKLFGLNVKKEKGKYHLINPPYKIDLNQEDLHAFMLIKNCAANIYSNENPNDYEIEKFIKSFELRFSEATQMLMKKNESANKADFSFYYDKFTNKVETCSKFCKEDYRVEIIYYITRSGKKQEKKITAKAQNLLYRRGTVRLQVVDLTSGEPAVISLDNIISIKQLPNKIPPTLNTNRVTVYGLRGRLAKNYTLRPWEYSRGIENGWLVIVNKDESEEELTKRLLKYGANCKVLNPTGFRDKILSIYEDTLKLYD